MKKILNLKFGIASEYQNKKTFFQEDISKIGQKECLSLAKLKTQFIGLMFLVP